MSTPSTPANERFEDRLLNGLLDRFDDVRRDCGAPAGALPGCRASQGPLALGALAVVAAVGLAVGLAITSTSNPVGPQAGPRWELAGYVAPLWEGTAGQGLTVSGPYHQALSCPSPTTCYVEGPANADQGAEVEVSNNAGKTWRPAGVDGALALSNVSCPSARVCALLEDRTGNPLFVESTDGGTTWLARPAPSWLSRAERGPTSRAEQPGPAETLTSMSCLSASKCSVLAWSGELRDHKPSGQSTASITTDDGRTWSSPAPAFEPSWELQCFGDGRCLAAGPSGAAYSTDGGRNWSLSSGWPTGAASYFSCATAARCTALALPPGGATESLLVSSDGGESWSALPARGLPAGTLFTSLACPTTSDCWLSGNSNQGQFSGTGGVLLSSSNGGRTWAATPLPHGIGIVFAVSCPGLGTCFASAAKQPPASSSAATSPALVVLVRSEEDNHHGA